MTTPLVSPRDQLQRGFSGMSEEYDGEISSDELRDLETPARFSPAWFMERRRGLFVGALVGGLGLILVLVVVGQGNMSSVLPNDMESGAPTFDPSSLQRVESWLLLYTIPALQPKVIAEIREEQLNHPFLVTALFSKGDAKKLLAHMPAAEEDNVFAFARPKKDSFTLDLYRPDLDIRIGEDSELETAYKEGVYAGFVRSFPLSVNPKTGGYLIDLSPWIENLFDVVKLEEGMKRITQVKPFPRNLNVEIEVEVGDGKTGNTTDASKVSAAAIEFSVIMLPKNVMPKRYIDERIGYFSVPFFRLDETIGRHDMYQTIHRQRLEKKNNGPKLSEVKKPIVYYIDETVPEQWREAMRRGVEAWNKAFEAAGFKHAIKAVLPGESEYPADFDVGDARYSSISWAPSLDEIYALGPSDVDPRSGEIIRSSIVFTHGWIHVWTYRYGVLVGGTIDDFQPRPITERTRHVRRDVEVDHHGPAYLPLSRMTKAAQNLTAFLEEGIASVTMHEVGHTLGLRHNFRGSSNYKWDQLKDPEFVEKHGLTSSVMDYLPLIIMADEKDQSHYFSPCLGDYDIEAIRYGYEEGSEEHLREIASHAVKKGLHYSTDEDSPDPSGRDPYSSTYDAGANPMDYHENMEAIAKEALNEVRTRAEQSSMPWYDFATEFSSIMRSVMFSGDYATKFIGGRSTLRYRTGDQDQVVIPIPRELQLKALDFVFRLLDPKSGLLGYESLSSVADYLVSFGGPSCDALSTICMRMTPMDTISLSREWRRQILRHLLFSERLNMLAQGNELGLSEMLSRVTDKFFEKKSIPSQVQAHVADARVEWIHAMQQALGSVDKGSMVSSALMAEIGRARSLAVKLLGDKSEGDLSTSMLVGICHRTSDYVLAHRK